MGWAKFDDGFPEHPKVAAAGPWAELLMMRSVIYCTRNETDGLIPEGMLTLVGHRIPAVRKHAARLVEVGLWEEVAGGWMVHDYLDYQPSKRDREDVREKARTRMRNVRANIPNVRVTPTRPEPVPDNASTSTDEFAAFNAKRAVEAVRQRKRQGLSVKSEGGLARSIQKDPEHVAESERLWAHRDCGKCGGLGFSEAYAPGAGMVRTECPGDV